MDSVKYLGVSFDKRLKWNIHISITVKKIRNSFHKFHFLSVRTMKIVFIALAQSIYSYRVAVWESAYETLLQKLITTINSLLKIFFRLHLKTNTDLLYKEKLQVIATFNQRTSFKPLLYKSK